MNRQLTQVNDKLQEMAVLPSGWGYGNGKPTTRRAIQKAKELAGEILSLSLDADVFPNPDGGCTAVAYNGEVSVDLIVSARGAVLKAVEERGIGSDFDVVDEAERPRRHKVSKILMLLAMRFKREGEWKSLESSDWIPNTTIAENSASEILSIRIRRSQTLPKLQTTEVGSPSWTHCASAIAASIFMCMSSSTIAHSSVYPVLSGASTPTSLIHRVPS